MASEIKLPALKENVDSVEVNAVKVAPGDVGGQGPGAARSPGRQGGAGRAVAGGRPRREDAASRPATRSRSARSICVIEETDGNGDADAKAAAPAKAAPKPRRSRSRPRQPPKQRRGRPAAAGDAERRPPRRAARDGQPAITPAGPATRRLARELGVDLAQVSGSGRAGRVVEEDVKAFVRQLASGAAAPAAGGAAAAPPLPDFEKWGPVERAAADRASARRPPGR